MSNPKALDKPSQPPERSRKMCLCQELYKKVETQGLAASFLLKKPIAVPAQQLLRKWKLVLLSIASNFISILRDLRCGSTTMRSLSFHTMHRLPKPDLSQNPEELPSFFLSLLRGSPPQTWTSVLSALRSTPWHIPCQPYGRLSIVVHYPSVSIRAAQSGLQSAPACRMQWVCHHLFRSYDRNLSNIANIRLHSVSGHTNMAQR